MIIIVWTTRRIILKNDHNLTFGFRAWGLQLLGLDASRKILVKLMLKFLLAFVCFIPSGASHRIVICEHCTGYLKLWIGVVLSTVHDFIFLLEYHIVTPPSALTISTKMSVLGTEKVRSWQSLWLSLRTWSLRVPPCGSVSFLPISS